MQVYTYLSSELKSEHLISADDRQFKNLLKYIRLELRVADQCCAE